MLTTEDKIEPFDSFELLELTACQPAVPSQAPPHAPALKPPLEALKPPLAPGLKAAGRGNATFVNDYWVAAKEQLFSDTRFLEVRFVHRMKAVCV
jgi:hypothetical protein